MPKATKAKNAKAADFVKPRLKLGKGKRPATNAVDTSFKARSIVLPQQSINVTKDASTPVTKRRLSLDDLVAHLKHYNPGVRKDALQGLRELLEDYPELQETKLMVVLLSCVRLIGDEDPSIRKALLAFFGWLLPRVPKAQLAPHAQILLLYTTSAQTHIFPEIRIDAVKFLDVLLEAIPAHVVGGCLRSQADSGTSDHGGKVLDGYLSLLNAGSRFGEDEAGPSQPTTLTTVMLSSASKATILSSLSTFLQHALHDMPLLSEPADADSSTPFWFLLPAFSSAESFNRFSDLLRPTRSTRRSSAELCDTIVWVGPENVRDDGFGGEFEGTFPLAEVGFAPGSIENLQDLSQVLSDLERLTESSSDARADEPTGRRLLHSLCRALYPTLTSTFLDCAPIVFSPSTVPSETELKLVLNVLEITRCLYGNVLREGNTHVRTVRDDLRTFLNHMSVYFPFGKNMLVQHDIKTIQTFQAANIIYCELYSLLSLSTQPSRQPPEASTVIAHRTNRKARQLRTSQNASGAPLSQGSAKQDARVHVFVVRTLSGADGQGQNTLALTPAAYAALMPTAWCMLNQSTGPAVPEDDDEVSGSSVLDALVGHATRLASTDVLKRAATEFVARLVLLYSDPQYTGTFTLPKQGSEVAAVRDWLFHLPKVLWELGEKQPATTEIILLFLLRLTQRGIGLADPETILAIKSRLAPFFCIDHPTRGQILGPYTKLPGASPDARTTTASQPPSPHKRLALDVVAVLLRSSSRVAGASREKPRISQRGERENKNEDTSECNATLRRAVSRAVVETPEEAYWEGVSR